jgi:hypothetical protein
MAALGMSATGIEFTVNRTSTLEIAVTNPVGLEFFYAKGKAGRNASLLDLEIEVEEDIPGEGWPIAINRATGKGKLARADNYALSFVIGFSKAACLSGFVVGLERYALTLTDWTAIAGTPSLSPGLPYFLGKAGGLSVTPDFTSTTMYALAQAMAEQTLEIELAMPTLL